MSLNNVIDALSLLKGKSANEDNVLAEYLLYAPLNMLKRLTLFNQMLKHAFVPNQFCFGFMIPLIKDKQGDPSHIKSYRGITISPIVSKLFEYSLKGVFKDQLTTSAYQFWYLKA